MKNQKMYTFYFKTLLYNNLGIDAPSYEAAMQYCKYNHIIEEYLGFEEIPEEKKAGWLK